jgi:hypothetical protein
MSGPKPKSMRAVGLNLHGIAVVGGDRNVVRTVEDRNDAVGHRIGLIVCGNVRLRMVAGSIGISLHICPLRYSVGTRSKHMDEEHVIGYLAYPSVNIEYTGLRDESIIQSGVVTKCVLNMGVDP